MPMPRGRSKNTPAVKDKTAHLERIRDNQRRCRARQKTYIAELENKLREHEGASDHPPGSVQLRQLEKENECLKRLLQSLGLGDDFLDAYCKALQQAPDVAQIQVATHCSCSIQPAQVPSRFLDATTPSIRTPTTTTEPQTQTGLHLSSESDPSQDLLYAFESSVQANAISTWQQFDSPGLDTPDLEIIQTDNPSDPLTSFAETTFATEVLECVAPATVAATTTLCSSAFSLVLKNNRKGYSTADLDLKLRSGYRVGETILEGCRMDNKILFSVLAEIS